MNKTLILDQWRSCASGATTHTSIPCYDNSISVEIFSAVLPILSCLYCLDHLLSTCASSVHALRMLKTHGLPQQQLNVVASATTMASLLYASPAWWGYTSANDRARIDRLINRLRRGGYLPTDHPCFEKLANTADQRLFKAISTNKNHVLAKYMYLPEIKTTGHNLRPRAHGYVLPAKDDLNFISRVLYSKLN